MTSMSNESVCQIAHSWVDVDGFHTRLVVRFMIFLQRQSGIFWINPRNTADLFFAQSSLGRPYSEPEHDGENKNS
jgi:hypothetical protein